MELRNHEIESTIASLETLKGLLLDGKLALAVVKAKNQLKLKHLEVEEAKKSVIEYLCTKDEEGKPIQKVIQDKGRSFISYEFPTTDDSKKCGEEIIKIDNEKTTIEIVELFPESKLSAINCSPDQMEALIIFAQ